MVKKILMVCLGNICRSPIAEAVMSDTLKKENIPLNEWEVDSAALESYHQGNPPDYRALTVMKKYNLKYNNTARKIQLKDFLECDYIFGMDEQNIEELKYLAPTNCKAKILLLGDFGLPPNERIIEDPYFENGTEPFEKVYKQCVVACTAFLKDVVNQKI